MTKRGLRQSLTRAGTRHSTMSLVSSLFSQVEVVTPSFGKSVCYPHSYRSVLLLLVFGWALSLVWGGASGCLPSGSLKKACTKYRHTQLSAHFEESQSSMQQQTLYHSRKKALLN